MDSEEHAAAQEPWFRRTRPDGRPEPTVGGDNDGNLFILDSGWAASRQSGQWYDGLLWSHEQLAEFTPVKDQTKIYRLVDEAQAALSGPSGRTS